LNPSTRIANKRLTPLDRVAHTIATGAGAGFFPIAPGTVGALEGIAVYLAIAYFATRSSNLTWTNQIALLVLVNIFVLGVGVWASGRTCDLSGIKDPHKIVVDEISGQLISLIPLAFSPSLTGVIAAFLLFRLFDIFKPYPIRKLEDLPRGFGVMADDALAGIYAALLVSVGRQLNIF
jgi:phosphatidylglycerophosphatase A